MKVVENKPGSLFNIRYNGPYGHVVTSKQLAQTSCFPERLNHISEPRMCA